MGQAKKRGTMADRVIQAQREQEREEPINVPCKTCGEPLNGFMLLRHSAAGAAWQKTCECGAVTTAIVQTKHSTLQRAFASTLGIAEDLVGADKKVSVNFYEKSIDTVETGIIRIGNVSKSP